MIKIKLLEAKNIANKLKLNLKVLYVPEKM